MKKTKTKKPTETAAKEPNEPKQVVTRFSESELEVMRDDTGASKDGSAVAAYVRKRMKREQTDK